MSLRKNKKKRVVLSKKRRRKKTRARDGLIGRHWRSGLSVNQNYERLGVSADANRTKKGVKNVSSEVLKELERCSRDALDRQRATQVVYVDWHRKQLLSQLIEKHGDDYQRMARDHKLNTWQLTAGQLRRQCVKLTKALI
eukprot:TRINITY_DN12938_c0_g1_i1.p2 TRINITY_DN12938_c0_g1~~TRINITY_DN12938_c0_g1_i1.p2  ORF type:complete len:140 (+),score=39.82 TRINITY_DN12938_c0_g1_i1:69-488(+)